MRLLLAAMECAKGGVDGNLRRHVELLEAAAGAGCDLAGVPGVLAHGLGRPTAQSRAGAAGRRRPSAGAGR